MIGNEPDRKKDFANPSKIGNWFFYDPGPATIKIYKDLKLIPQIDYGDSNLMVVDGMVTLKRFVFALIVKSTREVVNLQLQSEFSLAAYILLAQKIDTKILIIIAGSQTIWVNSMTGKMICDDKGGQLKVPFDPDDPEMADLLWEIDHSLTKANDCIKFAIEPGSIEKFQSSIATISNAGVDH